MLGPLDENRLAKEIEKERPERSKTEGFGTLGIKGIESYRGWEWCFESLKGDTVCSGAFSPPNQRATLPQCHPTIHLPTENQLGILWNNKQHLSEESFT